MSQVIREENKMGTEPVRPLLFYMSLPIAFSMLIGALYNIVDSIFVSMISEEAFTALSLAFPFQNLMIAVGVGTGVGINALLSKSLGQKNYDKANTTAVNGVFLGILSFVFFALLSYFGAYKFMAMQTDNLMVIEHGTVYIKICGIFSLGLMIQLIFEKLLQSTGMTNYLVLCQGVGAIINIILDPILIFGWFGFPAMGVAGAAYATVFSQFVGGFLSVYFNLKKNHEIKISIKESKLDLSIIKEIYIVGVPSIIMSSISSFNVYFLNQILSVYHLAATAVLGACFKLQSFIFMPVFGVTNGMIPIVAYNYGANNKERIKSAYKNALGFVIIITVFGFILFNLFPSQLIGLFGKSKEMMDLGVPAVRIFGLYVLLSSFNIVSSSTFQALGNGILSMIMSVTRQLIFLVPLAKFLSNNYGVTKIWWAFPISEIIVSFITAVFLYYIYKNKIETIDNKLELDMGCNN